MLKVIKPAYNDLWFRKMMVEDDETMSYNHAWGGTIAFPEERWHDWYDYWVVNPGEARFYRYLQNSEFFVGEIAYHYDNALAGFVANVLIFSKYRGRGYGSEGLELLCLEAKRNGINVIYDDIAIDNPAVRLFVNHGFQEIIRSKDKIFLMKTL